MKREWSFIIVLLFAMIVAVFAVVNVEPVGVNYVFGTAQWPLVLVILGSAILGALTIGVAGSVRLLSMKRELRLLKRENEQLKMELKLDAEPTPQKENPKDNKQGSTSAASEDSEKNSSSNV
ncbi:LapA family protein [Pseudalkalibacillus decolorationis]|uniref:LapA family protein n=1 Tax=Pseudalkalibacillus decolorationis TaxID=163879 RepID=UPI002148E49E|nr:lipopolysaccharide assembly protein LapA domain-containing protein [Pseudalkalibacillus decolorationis]